MSELDTGGFVEDDEPPRAPAPAAPLDTGGFVEDAPAAPAKAAAPGWQRTAASVGLGLANEVLGLPQQLADTVSQPFRDAYEAGYRGDLAAAGRAALGTAGLALPRLPGLMQRGLGALGTASGVRAMAGAETPWDAARGARDAAVGGAIAGRGAWSGVPGRAVRALGAGARELVPGPVRRFAAAAGEQWASESGRARQAAVEALRSSGPEPSAGGLKPEELELPPDLVRTVRARPPAQQAGAVAGLAPEEAAPRAPGERSIQYRAPAAQAGAPAGLAPEELDLPPDVVRAVRTRPPAQQPGARAGLRGDEGAPAADAGRVLRYRAPVAQQGAPGGLAPEEQALPPDVVRAVRTRGAAAPPSLLPSDPELEAMLNFDQIGPARRGGWR